MLVSAGHVGLHRDAAIRFATRNRSLDYLERARYYPTGPVQSAAFAADDACMGRPSASVVVSIAAVIVATAASSVAATTYLVTSSRQIKPGVIALSNLSRSAQRALRGQTGPQGLQGLQGAPGSRGDQGHPGPRGDTGTTGPAGPITGQLPSGATLTGVFAVDIPATGAGQFATTGVSYVLSLSSSPTVHIIGNGDTPPAECPGQQGNPGPPAPGNLCVWVGSISVNTDTSSWTTGVGVIGADGAGGSPPTGYSSKMGFEAFARSTGAGRLIAEGTWAVTAP